MYFQASFTFTFILYDSDCRWTGTACTEEKPLVLTEPIGTVASPTMYDIGNYPPNSHCMWEVKVPEWMVSVPILHFYP